MVKTLLIAVVLLSGFGPAPTFAQVRLHMPNVLQLGREQMQPMFMAQQAPDFPIAPSQAAILAKDANPGSKILNVRLLPSGVYAVTLKQGGSVLKVMVDATSGAVS